MLSSLLALREIPAARPDPLGGTVLALHGHGGDLNQLVQLCRELAPGMRLVTAEGPKTVTAYTVQTAGNFEGYSWYPGDKGQVLEPVRFGHALACLEDLVADIAAQQGSGAPIFLVGYDEGAVLALTLAAILPDLLAGAVAICGELPVMDGWELPDSPMVGLPVLLIDANAGPPGDLAELERRGARAAYQQVHGVAADPYQARAALAAWLQQRSPLTG